MDIELLRARLGASMAMLGASWLIREASTIWWVTSDGFPTGFVESAQYVHALALVMLVLVAVWGVGAVRGVAPLVLMAGGAVLCFALSLLVIVDPGGAVPVFYRSSGALGFDFRPGAGVIITALASVAAFAAAIIVIRRERRAT